MSNMNRNYNLDEIGIEIEYLAYEYQVSVRRDESEQSEQYEQEANLSRQRAQCCVASPMSKIR